MPEAEYGRGSIISLGDVVWEIIFKSTAFSLLAIYHQNLFANYSEGED